MKEIRYKDIIDLGFKSVEISDKVFYDDYGYGYTYFYCQLIKRIGIEWCQVRRTCEMVRYDKEENVKARMPIKDLQHLKEMINFFIK